MLFYALRYALGRQTFAPSIVIDNIKANIDLFNINDIDLIIKEIEVHEKYGTSYGMDCDKKKWMGFIEYLNDIKYISEVFKD